MIYINIEDLKVDDLIFDYCRGASYAGYGRVSKIDVYDDSVNFHIKYEEYLSYSGSESGSALMNYPFHVRISNLSEHISKRTYGATGGDDFIYRLTDEEFQSHVMMEII